MGFLHVGQAVLELLSSGDPPALASQSAGITGVSHRTQPKSTSYMVVARENEQEAKVEAPDKPIRSHEIYSLSGE